MILRISTIVDSGDELVVAYNLGGIQRLQHDQRQRARYSEIACSRLYDLGWSSTVFDELFV